MMGTKWQRTCWSLSSRVVLVAAGLALGPTTVAAQDTHLLLIAGLGGDPEYTRVFHSWMSRFADAATERYGVAATRITYLGESPELDPTRISARSTLESIRAAFSTLATEMAATDELIVLMAGHGTFRNQTARFNIPGPDLTPAELAMLVATLGDRRVTVVNTASSSGPFVQAVSGPGRVVVTATRSGRERNLTRFGLHFVDAFAEDAADLNKDERVSVLEAFNYAVREVEREYESDNQLLTEHAVLDDNGDGEGSRDLAEVAATADGDVARNVFLRSVRAVASGATVTIELRALFEQKAAIEARIEALRQIKAQLSVERYEDELEELLIELALKNREIRAAGGGG